MVIYRDIEGLQGLIYVYSRYTYIYTYIYIHDYMGLRV